MKIDVKKTTELSDSEIFDFLDVYNNVFGLDLKIDEFRNVFLNTCFGYSIHCCLYDSGKICGGYSFIPFKYYVDGTECLFACGLDLFIKQEYRKNVDNLLNIVTISFKYLKENKYSVYFGFPNDHADIVSRVAIKAKRLANLYTYVLPYKVGTFKNCLKLLNPLSVLFSCCMINISNFSKSRKIYSYIIHKSRPIFEETRYNWFEASDYIRYKGDDFEAVWKTTLFKGMKACYLIDVYPLSKYSFDKSVRAMFHTEKNNCGLFLFVGLLPFCPKSMLKVPHKFEPKVFRFDVKLIDKKIDKRIILNPSNWDVNLSSYDLL